MRDDIKKSMPLVKNIENILLSFLNPVEGNKSHQEVNR